MPKLANTKARSVSKQEATGAQKLLPPGEYVGKLIEVKVSTKPDKNGNHYWIWFFEIVSEDEYNGSKLRTNTGLAENQEWALKRMFDAFGVKPNVDTETLHGQEITLVVDQSEITGGPRKGKVRNEIIDEMAKSAGDGEGDGEWDDEDGDGDGDSDDF